MGRGHRAVVTLAICGMEMLGSAPAAAQSGPCGDSVVIAFGDTISSIARRCGVTAEAIMEANPLLPSQHFVFPGLRIRMPAPPPPPSPPPGDVVRYVVRPGDTLYRIARANDTTIGDIIRLNPKVDASRLHVGDVLLLPGRGVPPPPANTVRYIVRPEDTIFSIAREHGVRVRDILNVNPGLNAGALRVGDVLLLPGGTQPPAPPPSNTVRYVVQPGDTLFSIARANGMTIRELRELNPGVRSSTLRVGDVILVRSDVAPPSPPPQGVRATVTPSSGAPGSVVEVSAMGFRAFAALRLLAGSDASSLQEFQQVTTDGNGRATISVRVPNWAAARGTLVFAFETLDGRLRALSDTFQVTSAPPPGHGRVTVIGTLTREGVECQVMRGDDGQLYTLTGDLPRRLRPGDRVRVVGRIAEVSFCQQGTTISVEQVSELN
jgi:LysM repeat protein